VGERGGMSDITDFVGTRGRELRWGGKCRWRGVLEVGTEGEKEELEYKSRGEPREVKVVLGMTP